MSHLHRLCILLKFPTLGRVKTRLAKDLGDFGALDAYQKMVVATLSNLPASGFAITLYVDPPGAEEALRGWIRENSPQFQGEGIQPQAAGDLGTRLEHATAQSWAMGAKSVTLIGTDCPAIQPYHYEQAVAALEAGAEVVFGPAADGGYYLQAMCRPLPELFSGVPWSQPDTLAVLLQKCADAGLNVVLLEILEDLDDSASWQRWNSTQPGS